MPPWMAATSAAWCVRRSAKDSRMASIGPEIAAAVRVEQLQHRFIDAGREFQRIVFAGLNRGLAQAQSALQVGAAFERFHQAQHRFAQHLAGERQQGGLRVGGQGGRIDAGAATESFDTAGHIAMAVVAGAPRAFGFAFGRASLRRARELGGTAAALAAGGFATARLDSARTWSCGRTAASASASHRISCRERRCAGWHRPRGCRAAN